VANVIAAAIKVNLFIVLTVAAAQQILFNTHEYKHKNLSMLSL